MAIPKGLMEWAVSSNLDQYRDIQLILLKGHLLLDVLLKDVIQDDKLSFYGKVGKYSSLTGKEVVADLLLEFNSIRNRLAHEWRFDVESSGIEEWSDRVLEQLPYEIAFRRTKRKKIIYAIAVLADAVTEHQAKVCTTDNEANR